MRIGDWSSDVCSSDLPACFHECQGHLRSGDLRLVGKGQYRPPCDRAAGAYRSREYRAAASGREMGSLGRPQDLDFRSEEHTSELQSLMRISYAVFCLKKKNTIKKELNTYTIQIATLMNNTHRR